MGTLIAFLLFSMVSSFFPVQVASSEEICRYDGPDRSVGELLLSNFVITGDTPIEVGDTIIVSFKLTYVGKASVTFSSRGVFAVAIDPDGVERIITPRYQGVTIKTGDSVTYRAEFTLDKKGVWDVWPSYCIISGGVEYCSPPKWHDCTLSVQERKTTTTTTVVQKPDLIITYLRWDGSSYEKWGFYYIIENVGNTPVTQRIVSELKINGRTVAYDEVEADVNPLDPGEQRLEVFPRVDWVCYGDSDTITVVADYDNRVDEISERNNEYTRDIPCRQAVRQKDIVLQDVRLKDLVWLVPGTYPPRGGIIQVVEFDVYNAGAGDIGEFDVALYVDGQRRDTVRVDSLAAGEVKTLRFSNYDFSQECTEPGDTITVKADPREPGDPYYGKIQETNETNNEITRGFQCPNRPDLTVDDVWVVGESRPGDTARRRLEESERFEVWFRVRNVGSVPAERSTATLSVGMSWGRGTERYSVNVPRLGPGEEAEVRVTHIFTCDPTVWAYGLTVFVDSDGRIVEEDEYNNMGSESVSCSRNYPDLVITDLWLDGFTIKYKIKNIGARDALSSTTTRLYLPMPGGGFTILDDRVPSINAGQEVVRSFNYVFDWSRYRPDVAGPEIRLRVFADYNDEVEEYRGESNNEANFVWRNPGWVRVSGWIWYQEADALSGSPNNKAPIQERGYKPARMLKLKIVELESGFWEPENFRYESQVIVTDSQGYFSTYLPRVVGRELRIHIGGEDMDGNINYAVRVGKDFDGCNEYVGWNSNVTKTVQPTGDIDFGVLRIGARRNVDFQGYVKETYILWGLFCGWTKSMGQALGWDGGSAYLNIAETILVAREYADANRAPGEGDSIGRVSVAYPDPTYYGISWENPFFDEIYLTPPNEHNGYRDTGFTDATILHEYAHHLTEEISQNDWALQEHDKCTVASPWDPGEFAWFEGFAEYFAHLLINLHSDPSDPRFLSLSDTEFGWYESPQCDGNVPSLIQEGGVTAFLIDLVDSPGSFRGSVEESFDRISGLDRMIFWIFDTEMDNAVWAPDMGEFMYCPDGLLARARSQGYPSEADIQLLWDHYHTYFTIGGGC